MSNGGASIKISADTSPVKKSLLDLGKSVKDIKGSKVQIFTAEERKFIKSEMKQELALIKTKMNENKDAISNMVAEQKKLQKGSEKELELRKKIIEAYKTQAKLAKQQGDLKNATKAGGTIDQSGGMLSKLGSGLMAFARAIPGLAAVATLGYAAMKGFQANDQYKAGAGNRNRLKGLGVDDENFGSPSELARHGLTEQDMIQRRIEATAVLGRQGTSNETEMRKAGFERAFGLESGTMTGVAASLRPSVGGAGANEAQMKLQASILAAGIEDAIGPYLETATQLLTAINDTGTQQTDEITNLLAQLTKDGERTPELIAKTFMSINDSVKGATGEQSAFLQTAFARAGIGGGTLGGTKFAMASGGIMGQDRQSLEKRGYNKDLLDSMEKSGMFKGAGDRTGAILEMVRQAGGLGVGESISGVKSTDKMVGMNNLANNIFGTKGDQGFDALMMLEKVQNKQMSKKTFDAKLKEMQEGQDPTVSRLDKINATLSGQTEVLNLINTNLMENLGKEAVRAGNQVTALDNEGIVGVKNVAGAINATGVTEGVGGAAVGAAKSVNSGKFGGWMYDKFGGGDVHKKQMDYWMSDAGVIREAKKRRDAGTGFRGKTDAEIEEMVKKASQRQKELTAKDIGKEVANALKEAPIVNNNSTKIELPTGQVIDRTSK